MNHRNGSQNDPSAGRQRPKQPIQPDINTDVDRRKTAQDLPAAEEPSEIDDGESGVERTE